MIAPLKIVVDSFRPAHAQPGNFIARARVLNSSRLFVYVEAGLEDAEGRHIAHGIFQGAVEQLQALPPPPPDPIPKVEEPVYETPDPYQRPLGHDETLARLSADDGGAASVLRELSLGSPMPSPTGNRSVRR